MLSNLHTAALTYFMHQVTRLLEENNYVRCLLIDVSKDNMTETQNLTLACICRKLDLFVFDGA